MFPKFVDTVKVDVILSVVLVGIETLMEKEFTCPCNENNIFFYDVLLSCSSLIIIWLTLFIHMHQYTKRKAKDDEEIGRENCRNERWPCKAHWDELKNTCHDHCWKILKKNCTWFHGKMEWFHKEWSQKKWFCKEKKGKEHDFSCHCFCEICRALLIFLVDLLGIGLSLLTPVLTWVILWYFHGDYYVCGMSPEEGTWEDTQKNVPKKWCKPPGDGTFDDLKNKSATWFLESQV